MANSKQRSDLTVHVVEDHNDVLEYIYREIGSKNIAFEGLKLLHFDAHPDMLIPDIDASIIFKKAELLESLSIENWIIPAVFAGHFSTVHWIKPPWASQMASKHLRFHVGKSLIDSRIKVTCTESYFLGELLYESLDNLNNAKEINFSVSCISDEFSDEMKVEPNILPPQNQKIPDCSSKSTKKCSSTNSLILDIDLDFFSTLNPFKAVYSIKQYDLLRQLYVFTPPESKSVDSIEFCLKARKMQLDKLKTAFTKMQNDGLACIDDECMDLLFQELISDLSKSFDSIDWLWTHEIGCTFDDTGLPHHESTAYEIKSLVKKMKDYLYSLPTPAMITIARSSLDSYCPPHQVDSIQEQVLMALTEMYGSLNILKHY